MAANRIPQIEVCYEAAFDFALWPSALQKLADSMGVTSCVIRTCDQSHPFRVDQRGLTQLKPDSAEHAEFGALWVERVGGAPDPHDEKVKRLRRKEGSFIVEDELTTREERDALPYYQEIARPGDREWWAVVDVNVRRRKWILSMFRDARTGRFFPSEADFFLSVSPELRRIISVAEKVWELSINSSLAVLDQFNCAAMLLDGRGYVTRCNEHAEHLLGAGLSVRNRRIYAIDRPSDARLQGLIGAAANAAQDWLIGAEPVLITRSGMPWLVAEALPMTSFVHDLFNGGEVLLYFTDFLAERSPNELILRSAFRLTAAETRLALRLAAGESVGTASDRLAIGRETARTQLRAIFAKTGTHRQAELTALLSRLPAPSKH